MTVPYTFGNESSPIPLSQLDANFAVIPNYANTAGNVVNAVQANITSLGTLTSLSVTGNVRSGNLNTTGAISGTGNIIIGNISTGGEISAYGTVTGGSFTTAGTMTVGNTFTGNVISATGTVRGANITTPGAISATGNIAAQGVISATGNIVTAEYFVGNFLGNITGNLSVGGSNTQILFNLNGNVGAAGGLTYNKDSNVLTVLGSVSAQGNVSADNIISSTGQFSGVVTAPTPPNGTSNNQLATTAFVSGTVGTLGTMATQYAISVAITGGAISNVIMGGLITAPTPANGTSNTQVATTAFVVNNGVPSGGIIMWSGVSVPTGWYLCDGTNSTPDLRGRFIVGASTAYTLLSTGGTANAIVVSHTHTIIDPGHEHVITDGEVNTRTNPYFNWSGTGGASIGVSGAGTDPATTGITINSAGSSGTDANLPPYYALAYIMKA